MKLYPEDFMETSSFLLFFLFLRLMMRPLRAVFFLAMHFGSGLLCLFLLNSVSVFTGILFPLNAVTVAVAGFGGLPGIVAMGILALIA